MQKPHWSAWCSRNAACSGVSSPSPARPSTVSTLAPSTCAASSRHERTAAPSSRTVQAPQTPCSQPTCVPRSPSRWRRKSESSSRGSTCSRQSRPLTSTETRDHGASSALRQARPTARSTRTRVSCFRYAAEAWRFPGGSTAAAATSPASRAASASTARPVSPTSTDERAIGDRADRHPPLLDAPVPNRERTGRDAEAVVAAPLRQLLERVARAGWRGGPDRVDDELVRLERREEVRDEELVRRDRSLSPRRRRDDGSAQDGQRERQLRSGIRVGDRAADRAAVAGREVADVRKRLGRRAAGGRARAARRRPPPGGPARRSERCRSPTRSRRGPGSRSGRRGRTDGPAGG